MPITQLIEAQAALREACLAIGRPPVPTRMSFRVEFSTITGNSPPSGKERPAGFGTPAQVAEDLQRWRAEADLDSFQINFHGNHDLGQLLKSMECFMQQVAPVVSSMW
jgi:alkanesulfonate monooxygenase SsuD/methylene tetrahydromethanopterin reductase-like flavin-dependent oxidoreductase (luciferase family)